MSHWGRMKHICASKLTIIGSDNGFSPGGRQAIIWNIARILLIGPLGTNFSGMLIEIHTFSFKKMHWKMAVIWSRPQYVNAVSTLTATQIPELFVWTPAVPQSCQTSSPWDPYRRSRTRGAQWVGRTSYQTSGEVSPEIKPSSTNGVHRSTMYQSVAHNRNSQDTNLVTLKIHRV